LRLILTALARLPIERRSVFRGVKENLCTEYPKGKIFIWWGFSSCTSSVEVLENEQFFGKTGNRTLFQIECTTAKDVKKHSFVASEDEILLLPARQFQVTSCLDSGHGLHIVQLTELKPQYDLLEPVPLPSSSVKSNKDSQVKCQPPTVTATIAAKPIAGAMEKQFATMQLQINTKSRG
ncbi:unnamed protein product, partial [Rotaria sp. Silwood2]